MQDRKKPSITVRYFNEDGDGHNPEADSDFPGATISLEEIERQDGIITQEAVKAFANRNTSGVLQRAMTAISKDDEYRQELKTAFWSSPKKARQWVLAKEELEMFGLPIQPLVDDLIAHKAGVQGGLIHEIFEALTHTSFTTNYTGKNKTGFWPFRRNNDNRNQNRVEAPLP